MNKKVFKTRTNEYGYTDNYKRTRLQWPLMGDVADYYKALGIVIGEDRDTIMVYFKTGARLFMSKKSGRIQFYYIGTGRYDDFHIHKFISTEEVVQHMTEYMLTYDGTAVFSDVLSDIDKAEI